MIIVSVLKRCQVLVVMVVTISTRKMALFHMSLCCVLDNGITLEEVRHVRCDVMRSCRHFDGLKSVFRNCVEGVCVGDQEQAS